MLRRLGLAALGVLALCAGAEAASHTFTITLPTLRTDGTAFPLTAVGAVQVWDTSAPVPGQIGTLVVCSPAITIPPTASPVTCAANVTNGHSFEATVSDNGSPPEQSAVSNQVTLPFAPPAAPTLAVQ